MALSRGVGYDPDMIVRWFLCIMAMSLVWVSAAAGVQPSLESLVSVTGTGFSPDGGFGGGAYGEDFFSVGDVDGDGSDDMIALEATCVGFSAQSRLHFGPLAAAGSALSPSSVVVSEPWPCGFGSPSSVRHVDLDNDGYEDVLFSEITGTVGEEGNLFVIWGHPAPWTDVDLAAPAAGEVSHLNFADAAAPRRGAHVCPGDFNDDGNVDVLLSADASGLMTAQNWIVWGDGNRFADNVDGMMLGARIAQITQAAPTAGSGSCGAHDVNNDGVDDVLLDQAIVWGHAGPWVDQDVASLGAGGLQLMGIIMYSAVGTQFAVGDIDADGQRDLVISEAYAQTAGNTHGRITVAFGPLPTSGSLDVTAPTAFSVVIKGPAANAYLGMGMIVGELDTAPGADVLVTEPGTGRGMVHLLSGGSAARSWTDAALQAPLPVALHMESADGASDYLGSATRGILRALDANALTTRVGYGDPFWGSLDATAQYGQGRIQVLNLPGSPFVYGAPSISGPAAAAAGDVLTCQGGSWYWATSTSFQWLRDGIAVSTGATYVPTASDVGRTISCQVAAAGPGGSEVTIAGSRVIQSPITGGGDDDDAVDPTVDPTPWTRMLPVTLETGLRMGGSYIPVGRCTIVGTSGSDTLTGTPGDDVICGLGGNDTIHARGGNDLVDAGAGNDLVWAGDGNDQVMGLAGADRIWGSAGNDRIGAGSGADRVSGAQGRDLIYAGSGSDRVLGGSGSDRMYAVVGNDVLDGGSGDDNIQAGAGNDRVIGASGNDMLRGEAGRDRIFGGGGKDVILGGSGADRLAGGSAADRIWGQAGTDLIWGQGGNDYLSGSSGKDWVSGGSGKDQVVGSSGDDKLWGGSGRDRMSGGDGVDFVNAGSGSDRLWGGKGKDTMVGGAGRDCFMRLDEVYVQDLVADWDTCGPSRSWAGWEKWLDSLRVRTMHAHDAMPAIMPRMPSV